VSGDVLSGLQFGTVPDWIVAITALVAIVVAYGQLKASAAASKISAQAQQDQAAIARANLLLEIDRDFESEGMQEARRAIRALRNEIEALARRQFPRLNDDELAPESDKLFSEYMNRVFYDYRTADSVQRQTNDELDAMLEKHLKTIPDYDAFSPSERASRHYLRLTLILGWLERVGHMANNGLLHRDDVISLYNQVFIEAINWYKGHIIHRHGVGTRKNGEWMDQATSFLRSFYEPLPAPTQNTLAKADGISGFSGVAQ
jgi:hypothetical protein